MRVLFTGGRGLLGRWAINELVHSGHRVVSVVRTNSRPPQDGLLNPYKEVIGDARDPRLMAELCAEADVVVHFAAVPAPVGHTATDLLLANTVSTMAVLEAAGEAGVRGVVVASSISVLGMAWSPNLLAPLTLPIDEAHPLRPAEGYALSKECDEAAARMAARRWRMPVLSLRFPFSNTREKIMERAADPAQQEVLAKELWGYLEATDAARATRLAAEFVFSNTSADAEALNIVADDTCSRRSLADLIREWYPGLGGAGLAKVRGAYDTGAAERLIGFRAERVLFRGEEE